jgi:hypothetical protein
MSFSIVKLVDSLSPTIITGGLVPRGAYDNATDYAVGDSVDYNGSSYVMYVNATAGTLPTDTTKWQVLASKGATGATGDTGATGATGAAGANGVINLIQDEGTPLTQRSKLNFVGAGVTVTDGGAGPDSTIVTISSAPGGSDTQVQFNDGGSFGGDAGLTYNKTTDTLTATTFVGALTGTASGNLISGGALGTPSSGTLTNCTSLPVAGITSSTTTALGVGSVELGHASDTTIARASAGVISVEGVTVPTISSTNTLTNKRITRRVDTVASSATPTINTDTTDIFTITALATAITSMTTNLSGTPTLGQKLEFRILDNGTARAITWGASYAARGVALPTTTVLSKYTRVLFEWNDVTTTWDCIAVAQEA